VIVLNNASVCGGCRGFPALNNLGLALLLGDSLLGKAGLRRSLGQTCDGMWLAREHGAGNREKESEEQGLS
jgi:hypothetical protein